jgi:hypothetical protein
MKENAVSVMTRLLSTYVGPIAGASNGLALEHLTATAC